MVVEEDTTTRCLSKRRISTSSMRITKKVSTTTTTITKTIMADEAEVEGVVVEVDSTAITTVNLFRLLLQFEYYYLYYCETKQVRLREWV